MNTKWCLGTLIIILALFGLSQERTKASNQQIVLQFTDTESASETAHDEVLTVITKKLQALGVTTVEIVENTERQLSIRYYSDVDALSVKEFLSLENDLLLTLDEDNQLPFDLPDDQLPENYSLVVSDFQQNTDSGINLNGKLAFEIKQDCNSFYTPVVLQCNNTIGFESEVVVSVAFKINSNIVNTIENTSNTIPGVRAGPYVYRG